MASLWLGRGVLVLALAAEAAVAQQYLISTVAGGAPLPTPMAALSASIQPYGMAADSLGNIYVSNAVYSQSPCIFKIDASGIVTRVAGTGRRGFSGDGGEATNAQFLSPVSIAMGSKGDLYVADDLGNRIRKVSAAGIITTIAGVSWYNGYAGDGGPAVDAAFFNPTGLAVDAADAVYIADSGNHRIRKISTDGRIQTIAGNGLAGNSGDGGPAIDANLSSPSTVAVDAAGNVYIADSGNHRIRKISTDGRIQTIAGNGLAGNSGDGGPATQAAIGATVVSMRALTLDANGALYLAVDSVIRRISADGIITTIAGTGLGGFAGDGGPATKAQLAVPYGVAVDSRGNLFIADTLNNRVRRVSTDGTINTAAGNGSEFYLQDGVAATAAQLDAPFFVAVDSRSTLLISDFQAQMVRKVSTTGIITTIAGVGGPLLVGRVQEGQSALTAHLGRVAGVAADTKGNIFVADSDNACVWKIDPEGLINRVAGNTNRRYGGDGGPALQAGFITPWGIALDSAGNLYIADENGHQVRKVSTDGTISTIAGNGHQGFSGDGGPAADASLSSPTAVAVDAIGNLFIADRENNRIRKVSPDGTIRTVAGDGSLGDEGDGGPATSAHLSLPSAIALDGQGNLYISGQLIRKVSTDGIITTIAGSIFGSNGYSGDGGPATSSDFVCSGLAADRNGNVYLADGYNSAVRVLQPVGPLSAVNAASGINSPIPGINGPIAPGEIITLYGSGIGPEQPVQAAPGSDGLYGAQLAGTQVTIADIPAPLIYTSATQISAVVPYGVTSPIASITVTYNGRATGMMSTTVAASAPGIFTADSSGKGPAAAINPDGNSNNATHPARMGDTIVLFATGEGRTSPPGVDGRPATGTLAQPVLPVSAAIGGQPAAVLYAGAVPGQVAGLMQVNLQIPSSIQTGDTVPVVLLVGGIASQTGVTVAVR